MAAYDGLLSPKRKDLVAMVATLNFLDKQIKGLFPMSRLRICYKRAKRFQQNRLLESYGIQEHFLLYSCHKTLENQKSKKLLHKQQNTNTTTNSVESHKSGVWGPKFEHIILDEVKNKISSTTTSYPNQKVI